jgi:hypothetical protein
MLGAAVGLLCLACKGPTEPPEDIIPIDEGCADAERQALEVGAVRTLNGAQRNAICVPGGAGGAELTLVVFRAASTAASRLQVEALGTGVVAVVGPPNPALVTDDVRATPLLALHRDVGFESALRQREARELGGHLAAAREAQAFRARSGADGVLLAQQVGDLITLNAESESACEEISLRTGRIVAITERAIIVADTMNPANGFTAEEYRQIGLAFDTLVYPVNTENFGTPADIDENGRSLIFFSRAVNELTPRDAISVVGGFFFGRDLFPRIGTQTFEGCAGSNEAELFYMLVPDPTGVVNGNVRTKEAVRRMTIGVLAHEFQHLINASRRLFVNNASRFEEAWLNEGLSHIAEELVFYRASGLGPRQNIDSTRIRSSARVLDALNAYQISNLARLSSYLQAPDTNSPHAANDELETRGATWQLLRYAADRRSGDDRAEWMALVNSRTSGFANFTAVFGDSLGIERDWAVANYTDDTNAASNPIFTHPSWNFRALLPLLTSNGARYPLRVRSLPDGSALQMRLVGGGTAYLRFGVAADTVGRITLTSQGSPLPTNVTATLIRTK